MNRDHSIAWLPAIAGAGLALGAIALLTADAITTGHLTITHAMQPLLVLGTCIAAAWAHRCGWRNPLAALAFASLALLGSLATIYGTLGRQADARDTKVAGAMAENRQLTLRNEDLETARATAKVECKSGAGAKCATATARVDNLVASMSSLRTVSTDPRGDAIADLLHLVAGADRVRTRKVVAAIDPIVLPLFLEVGSILFFAASFPRRRKPLVQVTETSKVAADVACNTVETPNSFARVWSREEALQDMLRLKEVGAQRFLAARYGVDKSTISRWMQQWETEGHVQRTRDGQSKAIAMLAAPARTRKTLVFRHKPRRLQTS
jgi:transposase-like protein